MRFIAILLSFIVLWLSLSPCADQHADSSPQKTEIASGQHNDAQGHVDACSPFCVCQCCKSTYLQPDFAALSFVDVQGINHPVLQFRAYGVRLFDFFNPPQISVTLS